MVGKSKGILGTFFRDREGLVTVQVVLFSVMLFGGIGLMMDFGRAYSAHSQMQSYIDQVALAAARELDQTPGAVARATSAADDVAGSSSFVETSDLDYDEIVFLTGAPTDTNGEFDGAMLSTLNTTNALLATHVLVTSSTESVALKLLRFATRTSESGSFSEIALRTKAVATSRKVACGGLSPLVMCNPFEDDSSTGFRSVMDEGFRMKLTADITDGSKPFSSAESIGLGLLKNPHETMHVRNSACTDTSYLPGSLSMTGVSAEQLRDICLLATVDTGLSCINDQVVFKAAEPYSVTTGLNVIFDMFDDSMADIIDPTLDQSLTSPFAATLGSTITRSSLFYPDQVAEKGRLDREHYAQHMQEKIFQAEWKSATRIDAYQTAYDAGEDWVDPTCFYFGTPYAAYVCDTVANAELPAAMTAEEIARDAVVLNFTSEAAAYAPSLSIPAYSRQNYVFDIGETNQWSPNHTADDCLITENCSTHNMIDALAPGTNNVDARTAALFTPYILRQIGSEQTPPVEWHDPSIASLVDIDRVYPESNYETYYSLYTDVERATADLLEATASRGTSFATSIEFPTDYDAAGAHLGGTTNIDLADPTQQNYALMIDRDASEHGLQSKPQNFISQYGAAAVGNEERRRQRVTVVNCTGAESYASVVGGTPSTSFAGAYVGDVVDVVDIYLLEPPEVTACSTAISEDDDPHSNLLCANQDITSVDLHVEFVDSASNNAVSFDSRTFAVLVH